jgi:hypothetical protein
VGFELVVVEDAVNGVAEGTLHFGFAFGVLLVVLVEAVEANEVVAVAAGQDF